MKKIIGLLVLSLLISGCEGCSRSGRRQRSNSSENSRYSNARTESGKTIVAMKKVNGVYEIPMEVNGASMNFIFDTGASDITISSLEAIFLYKQGTLSKEDILGVQEYQIADGSISQGTVVNLRTIKIGNKTFRNIKASIVSNPEAPLLFGQSALANFGKVSIDYKRNEITFE